LDNENVNGYTFAISESILYGKNSNLAFPTKLFYKPSNFRNSTISRLSPFGYLDCNFSQTIQRGKL